MADVKPAVGFAVTLKTLCCVLPPFSKKVIGFESGEIIDLFSEEVISNLREEHMRMVSEKVADENKEVLDALKDK